MFLRPLARISSSSSTNSASASVFARWLYTANGKGTRRTKNKRHLYRQRPNSDDPPLKPGQRRLTLREMDAKSLWPIVNIDRDVPPAHLAESRRLHDTVLSKAQHVAVEASAVVLRNPVVLKTPDPWFMNWSDYEHDVRLPMVRAQHEIDVRKAACAQLEIRRRRTAVEGTSKKLRGAKVKKEEEALVDRVLEEMRTFEADNYLRDVKAAHAEGRYEMPTADDVANDRRSLYRRLTQRLYLVVRRPNVVAAGLGGEWGFVQGGGEGGEVGKETAEYHRAHDVEEMEKAMGIDLTKVKFGEIDPSGADDDDDEDEKKKKEAEEEEEEEEDGKGKGKKKAKKVLREGDKLQKLKQARIEKEEKERREREEIERLLRDSRTHLRVTAQRELSAEVGTDLLVHWIGNQPMTWHAYLHPDGKTATKVFYYRAEYLLGAPKPNENDIDDYLWLTRDELKEVIDQEVFNRLDPFLMD